MTRCASAAALFVLALAACGGDGPSDPGEGPIATIEIAPDPVAFGAVGSTVELTATPRDGDGNPVSADSIAWSTVGSGVVAVGTDGLLTSLANGTETVRATAGGVTGTLDVTVAQVPVSLELDPATTSFNRVGSTLQLQPVAADSNGNPVGAGGAWTFESSDPAAIHVDGAGRVTANGLGSADVTVSGGGFEASVTMSVAVTGAVTGGEVACGGDLAGAFPCDRVDLVARLPLGALGLTNGGRLNDMWGWHDGAEGREYALVGHTAGLVFVDVTDALNPRAVGSLPTAASISTWRDVKVHANHAYVVADGNPGHGVQVFDLTRLRDAEVFTTFDEDGRYTQVSSVHNIAINEETGFAYAVGAGGGGVTCGGGLHMIDLSSPKSPTFAGCFADTTTGNSLTGYTHDVQCVVYAGPDADYAGREICIGSNETAISISDVTDKGSPAAISTGSYPDSRYVHQGWLTEDHRYFVQNDELDEASGVVTNTRMLVWDVTDLDDPVLVDEHLGPTGAIDHNMYVRGDRLFHSNYHFGIRVLDISDPANAVEAGYFDTHPDDDAPGFSGSWSNYPWFADGVVGVTSATEGLFLVRPQP